MTTPAVPTDVLATDVPRARIRGQITIFLLGAVAAATMFVLVADLAEHRLISLMNQGLRPSDQEIAATDAMAGMLAVLQIIVSVATAIAWLFWQYRAYANLRLVGSRQTEYTPGWSVGYWFVPIINLLRPHNIVTELWHRSESRNDAGAMTKRSVGLISGWWICYISGALTGRLYSSVESSATTVSDYMYAARIGIVSTAATFAAAVLAIMVVRRIVRLQDRFVASDVVSAPVSHI